MTTETSIYEYAKQGLALSENKTAIWFYGKSITYRELFEKIDNVADNLYALGVREGTVVTIHLPNCPQAVMAIYAVAKLGGICNMVHALMPRDGLKENMAFTESDFLVTYKSDCTAKTTVLVDISRHMGIKYKIGYRLKNGKVKDEGISFDELEKKAETKGVFPEQSSLAEKCSVYLNSSGTTGKPKTVMLSHSAENNCSENTSYFFEKGDMAAQVCLGVLPLFHGFGLIADIHRNLHFGSSLIMMIKWNPSKAAELIKKHKVTLVCGIPAMFYSLFNSEKFSGKGVASLTYCYTGGDNVNPDLFDLAEQKIPGKRILYPGYGLTEATTMNCVNTYCHYKPGSIGYPVNNTIISVVDRNGCVVPSGCGEMVISSKTLMLGYLHDPDETNNILFEHNGRQWTYTGDEVEIDKDGYVFFKGRKKNIIIHNGYNVYPWEIEAIIRSCHDVADVCVVGVYDHALHTQRIRAVAILNNQSDEEKTKITIMEKCISLLPKYSVPNEILFVKAFPTNAVGKIDRKELEKIG